MWVRDILLVTRGSCDVFLGFSFEVVAQLIVQFLVRLRPVKQRPQP